MDTMFRPEMAPVSSSPTLVGVKRPWGYEIKELRLKSLGKKIKKRDVGTSGTGNQFSTLENRWSFYGESHQYGPEVVDLRFTMRTMSLGSGPNRPSNVDYSPQLAAAFLLDITCPSGMRSVTWHSEVLAHENAEDGKSRRATSILVARAVDGQWRPFSQPAFEIHGPKVKLPASPKTTPWSPEVNGISYPIAPGEILRFFFEFQVDAGEHYTDAMHDACVWVGFSKEEARGGKEIFDGPACPVVYVLQTDSTKKKVSKRQSEKDTLHVAKLIADTQVICGAGGYALYAPIGFAVAQGFKKINTGKGGTRLSKEDALKALREIQVTVDHDTAEAGDASDVNINVAESVQHLSTKEKGVADIASIIGFLVAAIQPAE